MGFCTDLHELDGYAILPYRVNICSLRKDEQVPCLLQMRYAQDVILFTFIFFLFMLNLSFLGKSQIILFLSEKRLKFGFRTIDLYSLKKGTDFLIMLFLHEQE